MSKTFRRFGTIIVAVLALGGAVGGGYAYLKQPAKVAAGATIKVEKGSLVETAAASGTIEPHVQVEVKSKAGGPVVTVLVEEGDVVESGQLLVELDPIDAEQDLAEAKVALEKVKSDIAAAQASLAVAQLDSTNSKSDQDVAQKSADAGLGTNEAVRSASHASKVASANVSLKQAQLASSMTQLKTAELAVQNAETQLKQTKIYAPMSGTVLNIAVEKGTIVASALTNVNGGTTVMTIADLSDLRIIGAIDEAQISKVEKGQDVDIRVDAYTDRVFKGKVERISPLGKTTSNVVTFDVEIVVQDPNANLLKSGMSADVEILAKKEEGVLLVPLTAVQSSGNAKFVQLASGERKRIKVGANDGSNMIVLAGLEEGDEILASSPAAGAGASQAKGGQQNAMRSMGGMGGPPRGGR
ncbi:MAG TPA: efflux RND transporter periplasmic adaptor subunit [Polyangiaceae bacterium]|nr:efflux RND transporter periplasmic adaptor subunit [Polyangiaceae bacterium]